LKKGRLSQQFLPGWEKSARRVAQGADAALVNDAYNQHSVRLFFVENHMPGVFVPPCSG